MICPKCNADTYAEGIVNGWPLGYCWKCGYRYTDRTGITADLTGYAPRYHGKHCMHRGPVVSPEEKEKRDQAIAKIRKHMKEEKIVSRQLSQRMGKSTCYVSSMLNQGPTMDRLREIADAVGVRV